MLKITKTEHEFLLKFRFNKSKYMLTSPRNPIRILLVDDHKSFLDGLEMVINSQKPVMEVVAKATNPEEAIAAAAKQKPDLAVMDMDLGIASTLDFLPQFLANTNTKVLILTGLNDPYVHESAILKGASGVLLKDESAKTILKAIEKVHAGEIWAANATLGRVLNHISQRESGTKKQVDPEEKKIAELTAREREIIRVLVNLDTSTNEDIADYLSISKSTLKNHLTAIYDKLEVKNRVQLMKYAISHKLAKTSHQL